MHIQLRQPKKTIIVIVVSRHMQDNLLKYQRLLSLNSIRLLTAILCDLQMCFVLLAQKT